MAPYTNIRGAFVTRLQSLPSLPVVAWENRQFTPPNGAPYLKPVLMAGEAFPAEIGNGQNLHTGIYQIMVYVPAGGGVNALNTLRDALIDWFKRGSSLVYSGVTVSITSAFTGPLFEDTDWIYQPITIRYRCYAAN